MITHVENSRLLFFPVRRVCVFLFRMKFFFCFARTFFFVCARSLHIYIYPYIIYIYIYAVHISVRLDAFAIYIFLRCCVHRPALRFRRIVTLQCTAAIAAALCGYDEPCRIDGRNQRARERTRRPAFSPARQARVPWKNRRIRLSTSHLSGNTRLESPPTIILVCREALVNQI